MAMRPRKHPADKSDGTGRLFALVLSTVLIQILVAVLLKELADRSGTGSWLWPALVLSAALGLNGLRFAIWGYTHKYFPLSRSYPLTALFFPCILALSTWYGEAVGLRQALGVVAIMVGIAMMNMRPAAADPATPARPDHV